ncbi:M1 family metallopeptidase [Spongiimicrobium salis]|uniref:M1 family metallopeptidase n=1 Tax=Spongiimicrobium salis TaxID=1667022 RepID=UPI00374D0276
MYLTCKGYSFIVMVLCIAFSLTGIHAQKKRQKKQSLYQRATTRNFNRLDSIKGQLTPLRTSYDVTFYDLDVEINPKKETIDGVSNIHFKVLQPTHKIQIDLYKKLSIEKILWNGVPLSFSREHSAVYVRFPNILPLGSTHTIEVWYGGHPLDPNLDIPYYAGFVWDKDRNKNYYAQAICQGNGAHGWWPNKDHLSDEPDSSAVRISLPSHLKAISNGRLQEQIPLGNGKTQYHWKTTYPINNYNITLNIGDYIHMTDTYPGSENITLDYYVLPADSTKAKKAFKIVKPMLEIYENLFGPYPFPRDGVKLIQTPHPMEHQSAVALGNDFDQSLILHEMAHEWWGNSLSCTDMAEFWIHEAFATYAVSLFLEKHYGLEKRDRSLDISRNEVMGKHPLLGAFGVNHVHYDLEDIYSKGRLMLHTLRSAINNDSLWFSILKGLQETFKHQSITTAAIVQYINQKTKIDYTPFFKQYLNHTTLPKLQMEAYSENGTPMLKYKWIADEVAFSMPIKVFLGADRAPYLFPTTTWQKMELPNIPLEDIQVDGNNFYVDVDYGEQITQKKAMLLTGIYSPKIKPSKKLSITEENGQFFMQEKKKWKAPLYFKNNTEVLVKGLNPLTTLRFIRNKDGVVTKIISNQAGESYELIKLN